jgi:hypothetical protein
MALYERHGKIDSPEYSVWSGMKDRCLNPNSCNWTNYGGRGITVCDRWKDSFSNFYEDMGPRPSDEHSIDRIDNDGNYEPGNCRWATVEEQVYNRRTNRMVTLPDGREVTTAQAMEELDMKKGTLFSRLDRGTPLDLPIMQINKRYMYKNRAMSLGQLAGFTDIPIELLSSRLRSGMDVEKAVEMSVQRPKKYSYLGEMFTIPEIGVRENIPAYLIRYHLNKLEDKNADYQLSGIVDYIKRNYTEKVFYNGIATLQRPALYTRHGEVETPEYVLWANLKAKCYNPNNPDYKYWGYKGATICDRWRNDFQAFLMDIGRRPSSGHYLAIPDKTKPIGPGNWYWTTNLSDIRKPENTLVSKANVPGAGTIASMKARTGLSKSAIYDRLARGQSLDQLKRGEYLWEGKIRNAEELSEISGIPLKTLKKRISRGFPLEKAMDPNLTSASSKLKNKQGKNKQ